jgi:hypothetical protein
MDDTVWVPAVFIKNRERLIKHDAVIEFFTGILAAKAKAHRIGLRLGQISQWHPLGNSTGLEEVDQLFVLAMAAYNLVRMRPWDKSVQGSRSVGEIGC